MTTQLTVTVPEARAVATVPRILVAAMGALLAVDLPAACGPRCPGSTAGATPGAATPCWPPRSR